ncbi:DUF2167 domain-containing protein [Denitromonas ohlonensis]|jgi:uncharacterized membrane-anchored protein|uniref:DUF2167 domain-containing protein n=2 Tax=Denitromonas TaxID=139331 RepID=A0A557SE76_9RHOO|nr:DUF2167 domain-containing protein [Denitromonas ohlonensis]TVO64978.1 DUF2167 domain-containing protein [Denitromonas ohlonensis]TVO75651.1 DUF2167 domain-containing protein [Denitromonas ohlonensis]TVT78688.1 MAG: DUF2167 domain-containing protein [Denitromonas halophila]
MLLRRLRTLLAILALGCVIPSLAQADTANELEAASIAATAAQITGPQHVMLGNQAQLALPNGFAFIPAAEGARLMRAMGNQTDDGFMGLVIGEQMAGFMSVRYDAAGYIKDDDARDWDAEALLQNLKDGTEAGNEMRRQQGFPEFVVDGWVEAPRYDAAHQRLVWSARLRDKQPPAEQSSPGVNYNTYQLGREGYISMNLVTDLANVESQKPIAGQMLDALSFHEGKRYADFNADTDSVAAYGLAALVGGVAAKKIGLLATAGLFLAKFWKIAAIAVFGFGAGLRKLFNKKSAD